MTIRDYLDLRRSKQWYYDAVEGYLVLQGISKKKARSLMRRYGLRKRLNLYTKEQLHYPIEATANEILSM